MIVPIGLVLVRVMSMAIVSGFHSYNNVAQAGSSNTNNSSQNVEQIEASESGQVLGVALAFRIAVYGAIGAAIAVGFILFWKRRRKKS